MPGIIACDIDGTLLDSFGPMPEVVSGYLERRQREGWQLIFLTGRSFCFAFPALTALKCPYYLAVQNGALLLAMPERAVVAKKYLPIAAALQFNKICSSHGTGSLFYGGFECGDRIFYIPSQFDTDMQDYIIRRSKTFNEPIEALTHWELLPIEEFASVKCFARGKASEKICSAVLDMLQLHIPVIRDPFFREFFVLQATHADATKGVALQHILKLLAAKEGRRRVIIAAGDDFNDLEMFPFADISIAMSTAPQSVRNAATLIAPAACEEGIIIGLEQALRLLGK